MSGNREEAVGVDGRLAVLGGDNDGSGTEKTPNLERVDHLPDRRIHECDLAQHAGRRIACGIGVASLDSLDQLLSDADGLEVHAQDCGYGSVAGAEVVPALDLVDDRIDLQLVIAPDRGEASGPVITRGMRNARAIVADDGVEARNRHNVGIHFGRVVIVDVGRHGCSGRSGDGGVNGVLVRPGRVAARRVDHTVDRVCPDEVPGIHRLAAIEGISRKLLRIDGFDATVKHGIGPSAIHVVLVDLDPFLVFGFIPDCLADSATSGASAGEAVAGVDRRPCQDPVVGHVVERAYRFRRAAGHQCHQAGEGIGGPGGRGTRVVHTDFSQLGEISPGRACRRY